ncbi:MAG: signal peptidase I [Oscillospiraceae bacterium]|nr:signal peptidase I [Oscillospiraceae bacterium]
MKNSQADAAKGKLGGVPHIIASAAGIALIAVLLPVMLVNLTLIIKSYARPEEVPSVFGVSPLIVESGSMAPEILVDDLIFVKKVNADDLQADEIIAFQPLGEKVVVTHRIVELRTEEDGRTVFVTKGDANNVADSDPCEKYQVVGRYIGRLAGVGRIALFLKEPLGMILCVAVPLALFLLYDVLRRVIYNRGRKQEEDAEKAELERLRALAASLEAGEIPAPAAQPEEAPKKGMEIIYPPAEGEEEK